MKILIIYAVSSSEALLVTPLLRAIQTWKKVDIHLASNPESIELLSSNKYINKFHNLKTDLFPLRKALLREGFDLAIDLDDSLRSKALRIGIGKKKIVAENKQFAKWLYTRTKINRLSKLHKSDQYLRLLKSLGIEDDDLGIDFHIPEKDEVENEWLPQSHQNGYAALAISASHYTKKLPTNRLIELCDRINKPIVLIGTSSDLDVANEIEDFFRRGTLEEEEGIEQLNKKAIIFNACGKFSLNQSASLVKNASWVFTYDNAMMHIASAFNKRTYTIWGSSTPLFGAYPYRTQFTVFENNKLGCRPCTAKGFANCPKGHFKCMNDVTFDFYLPE